MLPGFWEFFLEEFIKLLVLLAEVRLHDFASQSHGLVLGDEELPVGSALFGDALGGVVLDNVGSELVDGGAAVTIVEVVGEHAIVGILPLALVVVVAGEAVQACREALEVRLGLFDAVALDQGVSSWLLVATLVLAELHVLLSLFVIRVGLAVRAAVVARLEKLRRELLLLLFVDDHELIDWKGAINILELRKHRVSLLRHQLQVHLDLSGLNHGGCSQESSQHKQILLHFYYYFL